ncbi:hypothetical protein SKAU_G00273110 [Synaphobranchus kaupii]|uniref:Uncharacterized protein n=1 Tax=Synaphobranchus kaupii TaxID=118154 RepID=A0A9Q1IQL0_SYNKA|nr:hypothetical protein SKAU_G00273110 [Synaphobranchus kaupii]
MEHSNALQQHCARYHSPSFNNGKSEFEGKSFYLVTTRFGCSPQASNTVRLGPSHAQTNRRAASRTKRQPRFAVGRATERRVPDRTARQRPAGNLNPAIPVRHLGLFSYVPESTWQTGRFEAWHGLHHLGQT